MFSFNHNCEIYFDIEESDNKRIKASYFAVNDNMGYAHVLVVEMANVHNMFAKYHKNKRINPRIYEK